MAKGKSKKQSPPTTKSDGAMAAKGVEDGGEEKEMVILQSDDGMEFVVSVLEASQSKTIRSMIWRSGGNHIFLFDGDETKCTPIPLSVKGDILSKVVEYCKKHASGDDPSWDAKFVDDLDHETLCDLILAADRLRNQGLLNLTCQTVAKMIKGKSSHEICKIFNIRSYVTRAKKKLGEVENVKTVYWQLGTRFTPAPTNDGEELKPNLDKDLALTKEHDALMALHVVRCQEFTGYDPKRRGFICTRFCNYNIAFFDLDKESRLARGPPIATITGPISEWGVQSSVNVISLKVTESEVGYNFSVFGTVLARDQVDYRCLYLFKREEEDAQLITSSDDTLTLTDPSRVLILSDEIYFEIDLKIKCDGGAIKDFSKGVTSFSRSRLPADKQTMTVSLYSWLSRVQLSCENVVNPVEATIAINILKGPCNLSRVSAWTVGNYRDRIILYGSEGGSTQTVTCYGGDSVPLSRCVVAVPVDKNLVLLLHSGAEMLEVTLGQSDEHCICKMGRGELQVKVAWTGILKRKKYDFDHVGAVRLLH
uniref:Uncharacterized protein n=1 Tax=Avena sativa TaxID=4498 RepID=A0ACD5XHM1_AVESA